LDEFLESTDLYQAIRGERLRGCALSHLLT